MIKNISINYINGYLTVEYDKKAQNGAFEPMTVFYSYNKGIDQINNTIITVDNYYMLSDLINGALKDLEKIGVI